MVIEDASYKNNFHSSQIREQLSRIQDNNEIKKSEVLLHFLEFVIEETIAGRVKEIKEYTIGTRALGRPADFNPQFDAVVRIHAGRLRRILREYYNGPGKNDPIHIDIPKGGYVPVFNPRESGSATAFLSLGGEEQMPEKKKMTLAVFPFQNLSEEANRNRFADGFGEQLSIVLSQYQDLSLVSYYATRKAAEQNMEVSQAGSVLGAHFIITGSIRFSMDSARINVQLIFVETSEQVWAATYDRDLDVNTQYVVSDEVIEKIAASLAGNYGVVINAIARLSPGQRSRVLGAYEASFWYYQYTKEHDSRTMAKARFALESSLENDPEYALAWAVLGELYLDSYILDPGMGDSIQSKGDILTIGVECAQKAIRLDRFCQHGFQTLAWSYLLQHNREACLETMEEYLARNPNFPDTIGWVGSRLILLGEYERGKDLVGRSIVLNPFYPWFYSLSLSLYYYCHKKDYAEALIWITKLNMPSHRIDLLIQVAIFGMTRDVDNMKKVIEKLIELWPKFVTEAKMFLQRFIPDREAVTHLMDGLRSAGVIANFLILCSCAS